MNGFQMVDATAPAARVPGRTIESKDCTRYACPLQLARSAGEHAIVERSIRMQDGSETVFAVQKAGWMQSAMPAGIPATPVGFGRDTAGVRFRQERKTSPQSASGSDRSEPCRKRDLRFRRRKPDQKSKIRHVVVPKAMIRPRASLIFASAVPVRRPRVIKRPSHR